MPEFRHWSNFVSYWQQIQSQKGRGLLVLEECAATYSQVLPVLFGESPLQGISVNLTEHVIAGITNIKPQQAKQYLGRSHNALIYRACDDFNINSFCALCGSLIAGSLSILILPKSETAQDWAHSIDAQALDYGYVEANANSPFKTWWQQVWHSHVGVMQLSAEVQNEAAVDSSGAVLYVPQVIAFQVGQDLVLTRDQQSVVNGIVELASNNSYSKQIVWLSGARGRGKTVALAAALQHLSSLGSDTLVTSAATQTADAVLYQHAHTSRYVAIDSLLQENGGPQPLPELVVVEEAASLPLALLQALMQRFHKLLLVSSNDGYEGTGQGLDLKLPNLAVIRDFQLHRLQLTEPMRWHNDDPLESLLTDSFVALPLLEHAGYEGFDSLSYSVFGGQDLLARPLLTRQVYSLLALAHYKTTPQDLRILMDHPALTMHCWFDAHGMLVGVVCLMAEGEFSRELAQAVANGQRRIKGHLLAQILAQQAGLSTAAELSMQRIQRIAVHPSLQHKGIGKAMLAQLQELYSNSEGTQWLGSSFAAEPDVVRFWLAAGYQPVWAGKTLDAATGLPSLQVVLPIDASAISCCQLLRAHFYFYHTHLAWNSPLSDLICKLIQPSYEGVPKPVIDALVRQVGDAHGNVFSITPYLYNYLLASDTLTGEAKAWLSHFWQPQLTYKQFVQLTRKLVRLVQFDDSPEDSAAD